MPATVDGDDPTESLRLLDAELSDIVAPKFVDEEGVQATAYDAESVGLRLADVAGMTEVKARLEAALLAPLRNPELTRLYGKSLRGGLLMLRAAGMR